MESPRLAVTVCEVELVNPIQTSHPRPVPARAGAPRGWDSSLLCQSCSRHCELSSASTNPALHHLHAPIQGLARNVCPAPASPRLALQFLLPKSTSWFQTPIMNAQDRAPALAKASSAQVRQETPGESMTDVSRWLHGMFPGSVISFTHGR